VGPCSLQATKPQRVEVSFTRAQIDLPISPATDLAAFLPRTRVDRGSVKRPAPRFYKRHLKAIAGEALRCATKISPKNSHQKQ